MATPPGPGSDESLPLESALAPPASQDSGPQESAPPVGLAQGMPLGEFRIALRQLADTQRGLAAQLHQMQLQTEQLAARLDPSMSAPPRVAPPQAPVGPPGYGAPVGPPPGVPVEYELPSDRRRAFAPPAPIPGRVSKARAAEIGAPAPPPPGAPGQPGAPLATPPGFPPPPPGASPFGGPPPGSALPTLAWNESGRPQPPEPWFRRSDVMSKVLAVGGAIVVLFGVMMLLVLATQNGLFGPVPRTVGAALLAAGLGAAAHRIRGQLKSNAGAVALAAASMATALLDVLAITVPYAWIPTWLGLLVAGLITLVGMIVAQRWESQLMGSLALGTGIVLAVPIGFREPAELMAFLIAVNLAALVVERGAHWPATLLARSIPTVLITWAVVVNVALSGPDVSPTDITLTWFSSAVLAAIGLTAAVLPALEERRLLTATATARPPDGGPPAPSPLFDSVPSALRVQAIASAVLVPAMSWPLLEFALRQGAVATMITSAIVTAVLFPLQWIRALSTPLRASAGAWSAVTLVIFAQAAWGQPRIVTTVLAIAAGQMIMAFVWDSRISFWLGLTAMAVGTALLLPDLFVQLVPFSAAIELDAWTVVDAGLLTSALVAAYLKMRRDRSLPPLTSAALFAVTGMLAGNLVLVAGGVSLFRATGWAEGALSGFRVGHAIATVVWIGLALYLVRLGLTQGNDVARRTGLLVAVLAVVKLFLVDLLAVTGIARVFAFIVVGVALIVLGIWYARAYEQTRREFGRAGPNQPSEEPPHQPVPPPQPM